MKNIKYFLQFIIIIFLFAIFKLIGLKYSSIFSGRFFTLIGPLFRSQDLSHSNLSRALPDLNENQRIKILRQMWSNYGKMFAEYMFIRNYRESLKFSDRIIVENQKELDLIKESNNPVIFISGHFNNFELMAMHIEKSGIDLAAIYRPLNNRFLNPIMENIRKNYICSKQIKKGKSGTKEILKKFKDGSSIALMIDQRVSEGINCNLFNQKALTTTIPAQFVKKFEAKIVPIYIERIQGNNFRLKVHNAIKFKENESIESITLALNKLLEKMIIQNPEQWIWTHNRWK